MGEARRNSVRNWLSRITRNAITKHLSRAPRDRGVGGSSVLDELKNHPESDEPDDGLFDVEFRRQLFLKAAAVVRRDVEDASWRAFKMSVLEGASIEATAEQLNRSTGVSTRFAVGLCVGSAKRCAR